MPKSSSAQGACSREEPQPKFRPVARIGAPLHADGFRALVTTMVERLDARAGTVEMRFPYFRRKAAPVSGVST